MISLVAVRSQLCIWGFMGHCGISNGAIEVSGGISEISHCTSEISGGPCEISTSTSEI